MLHALPNLPLAAEHQAFRRSPASMLAYAKPESSDLGGLSAMEF